MIESNPIDRDIKSRVGERKSDDVDNDSCLFHDCSGDYLSGGQSISDNIGLGNDITPTGNSSGQNSITHGHSSTLGGLNSSSNVRLRHNLDDPFLVATKMMTL